jgi:hypothetical protein
MGVTWIGCITKDARLPFSLTYTTSGYTPAGTVHAYVVTASHPIDSLYVEEAARRTRLIAMLECVIKDRQVAKCSTLLAPRTLSACQPPSQPGSLVLHLTSRGRGTFGLDFPRGLDLAYPEGS